MTITAGVSILAAPAIVSGYAPAIVITPGAQLVADGTSDNPITFSSVTADNSSPTRGLWGGLIIMGNAPVYGGSQQVEGVAGLTYGGAVTDESSGLLRFVRVWYGGAAVDANNNINGITLAGVGSGTTVENVEVAFNLDDGLQFFGGTVNVKYASVLFAIDDGIDVSLGYQGRIQFAYVMVGSEGDQGLSVDSNGDEAPRSFPRIYSVTIVDNVNAATGSTLQFQNGAGGEFSNMIVTNVPVTAVELLNCGSETRSHVRQGFGSDYLWFSSNNIVFGAGGFDLYVADASCGGFTDAYDRDPVLNAMPVDADPDSSGLDPRPNPSGPAFIDVDPTPPADAFFESTSYKGAFGSSVWLAGWSWLSDKLTTGTGAPVAAPGPTAAPI
ncbi:MAG: hypothetical protein AAFQ17_05880, partial [Pseudomonadota bacterium]